VTGGSSKPASSVQKFDGFITKAWIIIIREDCLSQVVFIIELNVLSVSLYNYLEMHLFYN
jgi:hypothetical protein